MGLNIGPESRAGAQPTPQKGPEVSKGEDYLGRKFKEIEGILHGPGTLLDRLTKVANQEKYLSGLETLAPHGADFIINSVGNKSFVVQFFNDKLEVEIAKLEINDEASGKEVITCQGSRMPFEEFENIVHQTAQNYLAQKPKPDISQERFQIKKLIHHDLLERLNHLDMSKKNDAFLDFIHDDFYYLFIPILDELNIQNKDLFERFNYSFSQFLTTDDLSQLDELDIQKSNQFQRFSNQISQFLKTQNLSQLTDQKDYDQLKLELFDEALKLFSKHPYFLTITGCIYHGEAKTFVTARENTPSLESLLYDALTKAVNIAVENAKPAGMPKVESWKP